MRTSLSAEEIASYRDNGFLVCRQFLDSGEIATLKGSILEAIETMGRRKIAGAGADLMEGEDYYDRVYTQRINLWRISDAVRSIMMRPELGRMICDLEGIDGLRVWHDQAFIKEPFANPTTLHLDTPYWSFFSHHAASFHNGLTAHGAGVNMTTGRRIAMSCAYMPTGSHFNGQQNILPTGYFNSLKIGDPLDNEAFNPIVYRRGAIA